MALQWTELSAARVGDDDLIPGQMWIAQGHSDVYTILELSAVVVQSSSFKRWITTATANDRSSGDRWFSDTIEEAKQRADDHEAQR